MAELVPCPLAPLTLSEDVVLLPHHLNHPQITLRAVSGREIVQLSLLISRLPWMMLKFYRG